MLHSVTIFISQEEEEEDRPVILLTCWVRDSGSMDFELRVIEAITNNFADDQIVGSGGYGVVYRVYIYQFLYLPSLLPSIIITICTTTTDHPFYQATHEGEEIAVKKLRQLPGLDDKQFDSEFRNLRNIRHQNVVRLIGYCYESQHKYMELKGELVFGQTVERVLCFEYMQGGSLDKHIKGNLY